MAWKTVHSARIWALVAAQHGVIARRQLLELGLSRRAIEHRLANGRLYAIHRGVYAVGRRDLTQEGLWMAAVLACGSDAVISHESAGEAWRVRRRRSGLIEVSVPASANPRVSGIRVHRRSGIRAEDVTHLGAIPVTSPVRTLIDLATRLTTEELEASVNEADKLDRVDPETLRRALDGYSGQPGVRRLRDLLDRHTFRLTDSELERRFLRIVREAGLQMPETQARVCGFRVDFYWPDLGLVVETDGLRYHRTAAQQAKDRHRDQALISAGLTVLRFSHADVRYEPKRVREVLGRFRG